MEDHYPLTPDPDVAFANGKSTKETKVKRSRGGGKAAELPIRNSKRRRQKKEIPDSFEYEAEVDTLSGQCNGTCNIQGDHKNLDFASQLPSTYNNDHLIHVLSLPLLILEPLTLAINDF